MTPYAESASPERSAEAEAPWGFVLAMGALLALTSVSTDLYLPALPSMSRAFHASPTAVQGTLAAFMAAMGAGQLMYGPWSDRVGRRPSLLLGIGLFLLGSAACARSSCIELLIAARFVQGLGASASHVITRALIRDRFALRTSAKVLSRLTLATGITPLLGPWLGAYLCRDFGWRSVFFAPTLAGLVVGAWTLMRLEETLDVRVQQAARAESVLRSVGGVLENRALLGFILCGAFNAGAFFAYLAAAPGLLLECYGVPPERFGAYFGSNAVGFVLANQLNARLLVHYNPLVILRAARLPTLLAGALLAYDAHTGMFGKPGILVPLFFVLASAGLIGPNTTACALNLDPRRAGSISSLIGSISFLLGAFVSLLLGRLYDGTPRPMATLIMVAMLASTWALFALARRGRLVTD